MKHPVPLRYRFLRHYKGCPPQLDDRRDIVAGDIPLVPDINCPPWEIGFNLEVLYGRLRRDHQDFSKSCVGQGWKKFLEMQNKIEFIKAGKPDPNEWLSAKDIYSDIFQEFGGAFIRDGGLRSVRKGCCRENLRPSYHQDGKPGNEAFMRDRSDITPESITEALFFRSKRFVSLPVSFPLVDEDWENIRQVIWQYGGLVSGYRSHCMASFAFYLKNDKRTIRFVNSYGEGSDREYSEGDSHRLYDITFTVNLPNPPDKINMLKVVKSQSGKDQVIMVSETEGYIIPEPETRQLLVSMKIILDDEPMIVPDSAFNQIIILGRFPSKKLTDVLESVAKDVYSIE